MKRCYICGKILTDDKYSEIGPNSYICSNKKCFSSYYWDALAARLAIDRKHKYAIINRIVYSIGNEDDESRENTKIFVIQFNDGSVKSTSSLWREGMLPKRIEKDFPDNARFLYC